MNCLTRGCQNQTEKAELTCVECFARDELRMVEESMARVEAGENVESVKKWFFELLAEKAENSEYRKRYDSEKMRRLVDLGLAELLAGLGFYGIDDRGFSLEQRRAASSFGIFVFPPSTPF